MGNLSDLMGDLSDLNCSYIRDGDTNTPVLRLSVFQMKCIDASRIFGPGSFFLTPHCLNSLSLESCHGQ